MKKDYLQSLFLRIYCWCHFFFRLGYRSKSLTSFSEQNTRKIFRVIEVSIKLSLVLYLINMIYLGSTGRLNLSLASLGENYSSFHEVYSEKSEQSILTFELAILVLSAIPKFLCFTLGFYYFDRLAKRYKIYFISFIILIILTQTVAFGNQKSIGDIAIYGGVVLLLKSVNFSRQRRRKLIRYAVFGFVFVFGLFSFAQYSRLNSRNITSYDLNNHMVSYAKFDFEHPVFKIFGDNFGLGIATFTTGYLSNGYYGLSKSLESDWEWSYGVGNSVALSAIMKGVSGLDPYEKTYLNKLETEKGIPGKKHWHTAFPWIASDITWIGTLVFFSLMSFLYGKSYKEVLVYKNPVSLMMFALLTVMFIFVPANNQIFHGFDYLGISIFVFVVWKLKHFKYNIIEKC
ncbi:hypothetical protein [Lishizhenia sp.]|uniref:hypothetical protein n=1 Tax=Lishizhenia sp. TaxID=2497594 RepID=UPI00299DEF49|nr:hypothetical protein [Lishizhenia sp.]MDX1446648.1 hypothetical protein [Lishizhenia sp.]